MDAESVCTEWQCHMYLVLLVASSLVYSAAIGCNLYLLKKFHKLVAIDRDVKWMLMNMSVAMIITGGNSIVRRVSVFVSELVFERPIMMTTVECNLIDGITLIAMYVVISSFIVLSIDRYMVTHHTIAGKVPKKSATRSVCMLVVPWVIGVSIVAVSSLAEFSLGDAESRAIQYRDFCSSNPHAWVGISYMLLGFVGRFGPIFSYAYLHRLNGRHYVSFVNQGVQQTLQQRVQFTRNMAMTHALFATVIVSALLFLAQLVTSVIVPMTLKTDQYTEVNGLFVKLSETMFQAMIIGVHYCAHPMLCVKLIDGFRVKPKTKVAGNNGVPIANPDVAEAHFIHLKNLFTYKS